MGGTIRLKNEPSEGKDNTEAKAVRDTEGYEWNLAPNQTQVLPDDANRTTLASNATVVWGTSTAQAENPDVVADIAGITGRS